MTNLAQDLREIDRRSWITIALVGFGNALFVFAGLHGSAVFSLVLLAVTCFAWVLLLQFTRALLSSTLELAQESSSAWHIETDFSREVLDEAVAAISDLKTYDVQRSGIHLERLRAMMIKRYPDMEEQIAQVQHPLNMPGIII